uniref:Uncharacterized protein n=1 Tax=Globodera rostochiensis TaxID=31243 RepID=A0A914H161_GLORO
MADSILKKVMAPQSWPKTIFNRPQLSVRKCPSANVRPQMSVRKCPSAKVCPQMSVRKCPSANVAPQMSVRKCRTAVQITLAA